MVRALEQRQSQPIIDDTYAAAFLQNRWYRRLAASRWSARGLLMFLQYWAPGGQEFLTIRPRLVDDLARAALAQGLEQIVILGAGFDTMAWRMQEVLRDVKIFEADHPATQAAKRSMSARLGVPPNVSFVAVDFETDDFVERLRAAGFDAQRRTFIVWVGVSYYLTANAVAQTLTRIAASSAPGTQLVWDYLLAEVVAGTTANREALGKARRAAQLGEPWLFGLATDELAAYLASFDFRLTRDYEPEELRATYCPQRQKPMNYVRIAVCEKA